MCAKRSGVHKNQAKIEDFWGYGVRELRSYGVKELWSSDLHILNGAHSSLVTMLRLRQEHHHSDNHSISPTKKGAYLPLKHGFLIHPLATTISSEKQVCLSLPFFCEGRGSCLPFTN